MTFNDQKIIVTGASSGIGKALCEAFLKEGATVFAVARTMSQTTLKHPNLHTLDLDLTDAKAVDRLFEEAQKTLSTIDMFVANAGFSYYERLDTPDYHHIRQLMGLNLDNVIYSAVKMKAYHQDAPFRFVTIASAMSFVSMPGHALYAASKAGLRGFFDSYRLEMNNDQHLHVVYPVATKTNFFNVANTERKPWPVQTVDQVVTSTLKGIQRNQNHIHPSRIFKYSYRFVPWFFKFYVWRETKFFKRDF